MEKQTNFFQSNTAKIIMVGFLTLILLIPLQFVKSLIEERSIRQKEVVSETSEKWGEEIYFYGPILKIPYKHTSEVIEYDGKTNVQVKKYVTETKLAYFFPEELKNTTDVTMVKPLQRSLYKSNVFNAQMDFSGSYVFPNFKINSIADENIMWDKATIMIRTTNLKSIKSQVNLKLGDSVYRFEPTQNKQNDSMSTLETGLVNLQSLQQNKKQIFTFNINYNGSKMIHFAPIGKTTSAKMKSNWPSPSFSGNFLPNDKNKVITAKGFEAEWEVLHLNRPFPQQSFETLPNVKLHAFGVDFITTVDEYQQNERASKYGFLVIGLTFLIFFLIQSISKINIHIFQYSMIGLALIMFYTLLISITEHSSFTLAYVFAGASVIVLISLYSISILKNKKFPAFIGISLTFLYTFIFVIIQMEDYALLVGSIGLFLILAAVMYFSRKIDWGAGN
ncbi:MAG TPA: cell envelope integrity protein CreD [Flavobacterium sp.]|uniref:cell envelope integrity protein CreD n=1 Tax=unclassified Flavobacterium TaxID=196869 RepID=UPI0025C719FB|nr:MULTISPECIES: cell envelope integrity protein CreD [unclassified Flavobacterium]HRE76751.1 cell envelope integrity protein CreD [Flavobacterium sp.]